MEKFEIPLQIRWADIDANNHLRHSVYYDFGAFCRMKLFTEIGITLSRLNELNIGPVILREEAVFRREIIFEDAISITTELLKATADYSRWTFRHILMKSDGSVATTMTIDGAWIDTKKRKMTIPPFELQETFHKIPRAANYETFAVAPKTA